jgi:hypothetical protein
MTIYFLHGNCQAESILPVCKRKLQYYKATSASFYMNFLTGSFYEVLRSWLFISFIGKTAAKL